MKKQFLVLTLVSSSMLLHACGGGSSTTTPASATALSVVASSAMVTASAAFSITVTAVDAPGRVVSSYSGTVHFTSTDSQAVLPKDSKLTNGTGTFSVTLKTTGGQQIAATDTDTATLTGGVSISVNSAPATRLSLTTASAATTGLPINVTVNALDAFGNVATGYSGTVQFTTSDAQATLPPNSPLTNGTGSFSVTFKTLGDQTITATDTVTASLTATSSSIIVVSNGASTWYVNGVSGSDSHDCKSSTTACGTVGHAISLASSGDLIMVAPATYTENLTINFSLNLIGSGAGTTIIRGVGVVFPNLTSRVVTISNATAHVTLSKLSITNGVASTGGGISNSGTLTLTDSTVSGNRAPNPCVRLFVICELSSGTAVGGGIYNSGALIISNSIISGNQAGSYCNAGTALRPCSAFGGGIYNEGTLMMINSSTLTGNIARTTCPTSRYCQADLGGAFSSFGGTVTLNNSTVEGNSAGEGGGIANVSSKLAMNNGTVSGNSDGIFNGNGGTATLQNSIIANNSGTNCGGTITSHGYNLSSDGTCNFNKPGDLNNHDPLLGPLTLDNGGPTPTMALQSGSLAIDGGNPGGCTDGQGHVLKTDQRGMPRPDPEDKVGCDIGAYESPSD